MAVFICPHCFVLQGSATVCEACFHDFSVLQEFPLAKNLISSKSIILRNLKVRISAFEPHTPSRTESITPGDDGSVTPSFRLNEGFKTPAIKNWDKASNTVILEFDHEDEGFVCPCVVNEHSRAFKVEALLQTEKTNSPNVDSLVNEPVFIPEKEFLVGRKTFEKQVGLQINHNTVCPIHAIILRATKNNQNQPSGNKNEIWIIANEKDSIGELCPIFVNDKQVFSKKLEFGDTLQIGPQLFQLNDRGAYLIPLETVPERYLSLRNLKPRNIKNVPENGYSKVFHPRQMVALVGESGSGKTTFIRSIFQGLPGVFVDNVEARKNPAFRQTLGYVPQKSCMHASLTPRQILKFSLKRSGLRNDEEIDRIIEKRLRQVGLRKDELKDEWNKPISLLSGGQVQRVQIVAELIRNPSILLLDEPTSGLNIELATEIFRLLKACAVQGAIVIVVTHTLEAGKDLCDRVIKFHEQKIIEDTAEVDENEINPPNEVQSSPSESQTRTPRINQAISDYLHRELLLLKTQFKSKILSPFLIAVMFAVSLGIAVPESKTELLGFLMTLSVIWMSASLALMSIVDEREIVENERITHLSIFPYLISKTTVLFLLSLVQTGVLFFLLSFIRGTLPRVDAFLLNQGWAFFFLTITGWTAVGIGLLVSAAVGQNRQLANVLLPLVMMAQLTFSVTIMTDSGTRRIIPLVYEKPRYLNNSESKTQQMFWKISSSISYMTITRYADYGLRSKNCFFQPMEQEVDDEIVARYQWWGIAILLGMFLLCFSASYFLLTIIKYPP